jgi:hypothetical protein
MVVERDVTVSTFKRNMYHSDWLDRWIPYESIEWLRKRRGTFNEREFVLALAFTYHSITKPLFYLSSGFNFSIEGIIKDLEVTIHRTLKEHPEWVYYF